MRPQKDSRLLGHLLEERVRVALARNEGRDSPQRSLLVREKAHALLIPPQFLAGPAPLGGYGGEDE